jgi:selenide,water dikinase
VTIETGRVPVLPEALHFAAMGLVPAGAHKNRQYRQNMVVAPDDFSPILRDVLYDPQTSGGLLIGCEERQAYLLMNRLRDEGVDATVIGYVDDKIGEKIILQGMRKV